MQPTDKSDSLKSDELFRGSMKPIRLNRMGFLCFMSTENGNVTIINLRDGGSMKFQFPKNIKSDDRTNWESADVANGLKPLFYANSEPQRILFDDLCIDNSHTNESVEPTIIKLRSWMRSDDRNSSPPTLQIVTSGFNQRVVLTELSIKRDFFTPAGICIRVYLSMKFEEIPSNGMGIDVTPQRRSRNSLSGRTLVAQ